MTSTNSATPSVPKLALSSLSPLAKAMSELVRASEQTSQRLQAALAPMSELCRPTFAAFVSEQLNWQPLKLAERVSLPLTPKGISWANVGFDPDYLCRSVSRAVAAAEGNIAEQQQERELLAVEVAAAMIGAQTAGIRSFGNAVIEELKKTVDRQA